MHRKAQWPPFRQIASVSVTLRVLAVVVLLIFAIAAWFELRASRNAVVAETQRQMARLDMLFAEQTSRTIEAVDLLVMGAQDTVQAQKGHLDGVDEQLRQRIRGVRQLTAIIIVDPSGQPIVSTEQDRTSTPQAAIERLLEQYRSDPHAGLLIGPPFRVADNRWNVLLARPVVSPDGRLIQVAAGSVSLNVLEDFYRAVELNEDGAISLYLRDGTILARFPHLDTLIGTSFGNAPPFTDVLANAPSGTFLMPSPLDGTMRVGAIRALRTYPLAVVVSVEENRILAAWRHQAFALILEIFPLGCAVVVLLLSLAQRSRQIERLLEQTHDAQEAAERAKDRLLQQISEREHAEGAMRQAQRVDAIGQLTGGVAHGFNNMLAVVLGNVDILQRREARGNPALSKHLTAIKSAAERGATLTGHLLAFARRQPLLPRAIDLNATVLGMRDLLDGALATGTTIAFRLAGDLWPAMADSSQIELVILNLVINARDAMLDGGVITIETGNYSRSGPAASDGPPAGDYVGITVSDTGTGIEPDIMPHVFEPFFTTKPVGTASGLGLSQVFGTARQSGGGVHIKSEVGQGTAITVDLPRASIVPAPGLRRPAVTPRGSGATILLVDDNHEVRTVTVSMLRERGYNVHDADSGAVALQMLDNGLCIDVLLTDLVMPGINGSQLASLVTGRWPDLPVIFISGHMDRIGDTLTPGSHIIAKPVRSDELQRIIEATLADARGALSGA